MPHAPEHKEIVDAVIDGELEAKALVDDAMKNAKTIAGRLREVARRLVKLRRAGMISPAQSADLWERAFISLHLVEFARMAQRVRDVADESSTRIRKASEKLGAEITKVGAIRNADIKARALEKAGATNEGGAIDGNG